MGSFSLFQFGPFLGHFQFGPFLGHFQLGPVIGRFQPIKLDFIYHSKSPIHILFLYFQPIKLESWIIHNHKPISVPLFSVCLPCGEISVHLVGIIYHSKSSIHFCFLNPPPICEWLIRLRINRRSFQCVHFINHDHKLSYSFSARFSVSLSEESSKMMMIIVMTNPDQDLFKGCLATSFWEDRRPSCWRGCP